MNRTLDNTALLEMLLMGIFACAVGWPAAMSSLDTALAFTSFLELADYLALLSAIFSAALALIVVQIMTRNGKVGLLRRLACEALLFIVFQGLALFTITFICVGL